MLLRGVDKNSAYPKQKHKFTFLRTLPLYPKQKHKNMLRTLGVQKRYINIYLCLRRVPDVGVSCCAMHDSTPQLTGD